MMAILLPGFICGLAMVFQGIMLRKRMTWRGFGRILFSTLFYPLWILIQGYKTLTSIPDVRMMVHVKLWGGLLESSWMFLIQVVLFQISPPVGHMALFGFNIQNGEFWFRVTGIVLSFFAFVYAVTEYHVLVDGKVTQPLRQLKLAPFFIVNFLFRTLTISLFWVYWKLPTSSILILLCLTNILITRRTLLKDFNERINQRLTFCCIVGGMISQLAPILALFDGQTANKWRINYFYLRNIRINNFLLLIIFTGLFFHVNLTPLDRSLLNRNALLGCHHPGLPYTMDELGIYDEGQFRELNSTTHSMEFFGTTWTVREATSSEYPVPTVMNSTEYFYRPLYLIAPECQPGQSPVEMFNTIAVPVIFGLGIISTLTSFLTFHMD